MNKIAIVVIIALASTGCTTAKNYSKNVKTTDSYSAYKTTSTEACFIQTLSFVNFNGASFSVAKIEDKTGKTNLEEGNKLSSGASDMVFTMLGEISRFGGMRLVERIDIKPFDVEYGLLDKKQLGTPDGSPVTLTSGRELPYMPLTMGRVAPLDYYVTGAITELNFDVYSDGAKVKVDAVSLSNRSVQATIAADIRVVNAKTLEVMATTSFRKAVNLSEGRNSVSGAVSFQFGNNANDEIQLAVRNVVNTAVGAAIAKAFRVRNSCAK